MADQVGDAGRDRPEHQLAQRAAQERPVGEPGHQPAAAIAGQRYMNRTGLLIAFGVAAAVGLLFGFYPKLDLTLADVFYDPRMVGSWLGNWRPLQWLRWISSWLIALVAAPAFVVLAVKLVLPRRPLAAVLLEVVLM